MRAARDVAEEFMPGRNQFAGSNGRPRWRCGGGLPVLAARWNGAGHCAEAGTVTHQRGKRHRGKAGSKRHERTPGIEILAAALTWRQQAWL
jgi:hypothetical protein